jgi:PEP-CTERM motif
MRNRLLQCVSLPTKVLSILLLMPVLASATTLSFTGNLDPADANDVYLTSFTLAGTNSLHVQSWGYGGTSGAPGGTNAAGVVIQGEGFDPYITLFLGNGPSATFLASNDDGGCGPAAPDPVCEDFRLDVASLAAGTYTLALSLPNNFSFAENYGSGNLGDGFIGLQNDYYDSASDKVRTSAYAFDVTYVAASGSPPSTVPEPGSFVLLATGLAVSLTQRRRR